MAVSVPTAMAAESIRNHFLILNSYDECSPWVQEYISGLMYYLVNEKGVGCHVRHLNSALIDNDSVFDATLHKNLDHFDANPPTGVIIIGRPAFSAREEISRRWKDVPMLYMGLSDQIMPKEYEYAGSNIDDAPVVNLKDIRNRYNFTFVKIPDHYRKTIDMMVAMQPQLERIVYASNDLSTSVQLRDSIRMYLDSKYPAIKMEWLNAGHDDDKLKDLLSEQHPETGVLLGNWYHLEDDDLGEKVFTAGDVVLIDQSPQPVFTIKENYMKAGVVGGVLPIRDDIMVKSYSVIDRMLKGDDMRDIPLNLDDEGVAYIDYSKLAEKGLNDYDLPGNTVYLNKPTNMIERNPLPFAIGLLILLTIVALVWGYYRFKGKTEIFMKKHEIKINQLPVNYFIGKVTYDDAGTPIDIETVPGNQKASDLLERNQEEGDTKPIFNEKNLLKAVGKLGDDGRGTTYTEYFAKTDSYYEVTLHKGYDPDVIEIFCFNITPRIKSQQELMYTSAMLQMTLDLAQIVPWQWNLETKTIEMKYSDPLMKFNYHHPSDEGTEICISEDTLFSLIHPEDVDRVRSVSIEMKTGKLQYTQIEFRLMIKDGKGERIEWIEVNSSVDKYDEDNKPLRIIGSFARITERKEQMIRLVEARESAKEADRLKSAFLANMSHEIRTPLNSIVGFSNMLADTDDPEQKKKFISIIEANNEMLLQIISDILDISKTEAGTMEFNIRATDFNKLLANIGESIVERVNPGVQLICNLGMEECWIETDPNRLSQVVINFLTNAIKFTKEGSISFGYEVRDDMLYFSCQDTGTGISIEDQSKVFKRFIKLNSFVKGTGLGLPICKAIVEFFGGVIGVSSEGEGHGSTFWFEIPYKPVVRPQNCEEKSWPQVIDITEEHARELYSDLTNVAPDDMDEREEAFFEEACYPEGIPPFNPQYGPEWMPPYGSGFGPNEMPFFGMPFGPEGMPPFMPAFPPVEMAGAEVTEVTEVTEEDTNTSDEIHFTDNQAEEPPTPEPLPETPEGVMEAEQAEFTEATDLTDNEEGETRDDATVTPDDENKNSEATEDMEQQKKNNQSKDRQNQQAQNPNGAAPYGYPQHPQHPYGQNPYGYSQHPQHPYGYNPYGYPQHPQHPYGYNPYGYPQHPQHPYGQNPYGYPQHPQHPYGQNPYGYPQHPQHPYGQNPYGYPQHPQHPYGQNGEPYQHQGQPRQPYGQQAYEQRPDTRQETPGQEPLNQADRNIPDQQPPHQAGMRFKEQLEKTNPNIKKIKVLIAEDNESNYTLYEHMLTGNYELIHAWNGEEAVELFEQTHPDIILMDISMPKMDGYEATNEIKRKDALVPIIAVTAYAFATDKERMLESGFNGYVSKPINHTRLKEEIADVLKKQ